MKVLNAIYKHAISYYGYKKLCLRKRFRVDEVYKKNQKKTSLNFQILQQTSYITLSIICQ